MTSLKVEIHPYSPQWVHSSNRITILEGQSQLGGNSIKADPTGTHVFTLDIKGLYG